MSKTRTFTEDSFESWQETHYEVVKAIEAELERDDIMESMTWEEQNTKLSKILSTEGRGGLYIFAKEITDEFEEANEGREWGVDGDYDDELEAFLQEKFK